jgi:protein SCO1/2
LILVALAALSWLAFRVNGPVLRSFDGSVVLHHVGDIALTDDRNEPLVIGRARTGSLVILGYTRCTDECPLTLARVAMALTGMPNDERPATFFVTVDPEHDRPAILRAYLRTWHNRITGVTGPAAALHRFYVALGSNDPGSRYRDHDTRLFLLNSQGDVEEELSPEASPGEIRTAFLTW